MLGVDSQMSINRGPQVVGRQWPIFGGLTKLICRADDLSHSQTTSGNKDRHGAGPVITAGLHDASAGPRLVTNARGVPKLSRDDHEHLPVESACIDVFKGAIPLCADRTHVRFENARTNFENIEEYFGFLLFFAGVRHSRIEWIQH